MICVCPTCDPQTLPLLLGTDTYREVYLGSQRIALAVVSCLAMARGDGGLELSFEGGLEVEGGVEFEGAVLMGMVLW